MYGFGKQPGVIMDDVQGAAVLAELSELRQRVAELEAQTALESPAAEERSTRRGMLRLAGAAVVGGAAASLVGAQPAAATTGPMSFGAGNDAGSSLTTLTSTAVNTFTSTNTAGNTGVAGFSTGNGTGLIGTIESPTGAGWGIAGFSNGTAGYGVVAEGGAAQLWLNPFPTGTVAPTADSHSVGEFVVNAGGFFTCVVAGTPGTWRKLSGPATAGALHPITPTRVYDSRAPLPSPGILAAGANRTISVADGRYSNGTVVTPDLVPVGATAVAANVTVTGTTGSFGFLCVNPGGSTSESSSTINWFGAGQNIANGVSLTLNASRELTVVCGLGGGSTHFIVDISGYYL
jgi:hypothetical protein